MSCFHKQETYSSEFLLPQLIMQRENLLNGFLLFNYSDFIVKTDFTPLCMLAKSNRQVEVYILSSSLNNLKYWGCNSRKRTKMLVNLLLIFISVYFYSWALKFQQFQTHILPEKKWRIQNILIFSIISGLHKGWNLRLLKKSTRCTAANLKQYHLYNLTLLYREYHLVK